ncbi:MAG: hypothetical protein RH859_03180 [Longimicrobiales bacterium]
MTDRRSWLLFGGVILLSAGVVALAFNPAPHTGGDNAGYVTLAYSLLADGTYTELFDPAGNPHTKYPPVFPALLAGLMLLGVRSWAGLKLVAAASTVVAVAATWLWARRRLGPLGAAAVAAALAVSAGVVYYSHWILSDPTFLALTMVGLWALDTALDPGPDDGRTGEPGAAAASGAATAWLVAGVAFTGLAYFTRSAGLPLLLALLAVLALRKRWRSLAASAAVLGLPALMWWLRARSVTAAEAQYGSEFWMVDPYQPALGTVGVAGLLGRVITNAVGYVGTHIPAGIVGSQGPLAATLGIALVALGVAGWVVTVRRRQGPAELFFPLYAGVILLWPEVWSGDRFALPLLPLLFVYGALALRDGARRIGGAAVLPAAAVAFLAVFVPALSTLGGAVTGARTCAELVAVEGPFACYGPRWMRFAEGAAWAGNNLPDGSAVLSRKPRMFYVLSGVPSRTFPFVGDPAAQLAEADAVGARYVLMDQVDNLAQAYVGSALQAAPASFCSVRGFGTGGGGIGTHLLGVLPPAERAVGGVADDGSIRVVGCSPAYLRPGATDEAYSLSSTIPLLESLP